jgi:osmoprotectant transport system ATP-binding protein
MGYALRYQWRGEGEAVDIAVRDGETRRLHLSDGRAKTGLVTAVLEARCRPHEELELLGQPLAGLDATGRARVRERVGVLTPAVGLISSLNAWENISLPASYHGAPLARVAGTAKEVLDAIGAEPQHFLSRLPDELDAFEKKLVEFIRLLVAEPALALIDALCAGLNRDECARAGRFEHEFRARVPSGTLVFVDLREDAP